MAMPTHATRERPILFSGPMVRAILDGHKSQTRRVVKPQPPEWAQYCNAGKMLNVLQRWVPSWMWQWSELEQSPPRPLRRWPIDARGDDYYTHCPYGRPGERLWVRETWRPSVNGITTRQVWFRADGDAPTGFSGPHGLWSPRWHPSIHMPRWACRLVLELTDVRVERLQAITEDDAIAEGMPADGSVPPRALYEDLWQELNGSRGYGWDVNPWVWVLTLKRVED